MWPKNITLGEGTFYMDHNHPLAKGVPVIEPSEPIPDYVKSINFPVSASAEFEADVEIDGDTFAKFAGVDLARDCDMSYTLEYSNVRQVQVRRHKKKRINKKWAKRYGFRTVYDKVRFRDVSLVPKGCGMGFECVTNQPFEFERGR